MNVQNFITKTEYPEFKKMMLQEFITRPLDIKATTSEGIAIDVRASQIAIEKLIKAFKVFESLAQPEVKEKGSWK
jgi:hypothetical protein